MAHQVCIFEENKPGRLARDRKNPKRCSHKCEGKVNIEDSFGVAIREKETGVLNLDVEEMPQPHKAVSEAGFPISDDAELYSL